MGKINIRSTLAIRPRKNIAKFFTVTRGSSAEFLFNLADTWATLDIIEQITFSFKYKRQLNYFELFHYLRLTEDTEFDDSKVYYNNISLVEETSRQITATPVVANDLSINPFELGYYEEVSPEHSENDLYYFIDPHFIFHENNVISLILDSHETLKFAPTASNGLMDFEIAIRLNTDANESFGCLDSVLIYTQPSVIVQDSLYGQIDKNNELTVSINPERLASSKITVKD